MPTNQWGDFCSTASQTKSATETYLGTLEIESPKQGVAAQTSAPVLAGVNPKAIAWNNWT
jgi:hypothetical protein